ncbi:MAG: citrate/2-methylcitrate synthase, partial [Planctomycetota bacterium]
MSTATSDPNAAAKGLKGVKAGDSSICLVNGEEGKLLYRGYHIDDLAEQATYEEVAYLLLNGELPTAAQLDEFDDPLSKDAHLVSEVKAFIAAAPKSAHPMAVLRTAVSLSGLYDATADDNSVAGARGKAIRLIAKIPTMVAAIHRARSGLEPIDPVADKSVAWNFVRGIKGTEPTADEEKAMDLILTLHAEHGFNASTFACRVTIATLTDFYSAITSGVGTLKGKLHGGANTAVLKTLQEVG